jgi:hypothetical protein
MSPEPSPELPPLGDSLAVSSNLGSLAQSARAKQLKTARIILIVVGTLTAAINGFMYVNTPNEVNQVMQQLNAPQAQGLEAQKAITEVRDRIALFCHIIYGATVALGVVFIVLGLMVYAYPVPVTVLALVLYIGATAVFGYLSPMTLAQGWLMKIIVIVVLVKSIQAAVAYQKG